MGKSSRTLLILVLTLAFCGCTPHAQDDERVKETSVSILSSASMATQSSREAQQVQRSGVLPYEGFTINGIHVEDDFGAPTEILRESDPSHGRFTNTWIYDGFRLVDAGQHDTDDRSFVFEILEASVEGPRGIRIGDTLQQVLDQLPPPEESTFSLSDYQQYLAWEPRSIELLGTGNVVIEIGSIQNDRPVWEKQEIPAGTILLEEQGRAAQLVSVFMYSTEVSVGYFGATFRFDDDRLIQMRMDVLHPPSAYWLTE